MNLEVDEPARPDQYEAYVMGPPYTRVDESTGEVIIDADTVLVDVRTLSDPELERLRIEAHAAGDENLVATIARLGRV